MKKSFRQRRSTPKSLDICNIDVILQAQDVRQRHHPGEQIRYEYMNSVTCYGEDSEDTPDGFDESQ